jgi:threonine/homoserine/homoserine lactone efflux protein
MPSWAHLVPFLAATFVFAVIPGPAILYAVAQTMARGRLNGFVAAAGLSVGGMAHVAAAAAGLSAIFRYSPTLFLLVKLGGAIYLVWLGIQTIRAKGGVQLPTVAGKSVRRTFAESVVVELLNPKTALFFIAFLPQFVDGAATLPIWTQFLVLGLIVNLSFSAADIAFILLTDKALGRLRRSPRATRLMRLVGGSTLIGLGAHMAAGRS